MFPRAMVEKKGFTLIEIIVTTAIISILAATSVAAIVTAIQLFIHMPMEMKARSAADAALRCMIDGEPGKRGMRYAAEVLEATNSLFAYRTGYPTNKDKMNVKFECAASGSRYEIRRSYTASGADLDTPPPHAGGTYLPSGGDIIPYYASGNVSTEAQSTPLTGIFTYYDASGTQMSAPVASDQLNDIRRVEIKINVKIGAGALTAQSIGSSFQATSSVDIKQYI